MTRISATLPAVSGRLRVERDAAEWQPRRRALLLPSIAVALASLLLVLVPELRQSPDWAHHITPLWGLAAAVVAGLLGRVRLSGDVLDSHPRLVGAVAGLAALTLAVGVMEWPGGM